MLLDEFEFQDITKLLDEVSPDEVSGCPPVLVKKELRRSLRTFCRRSLWWRATLDTMAAVKGVTNYSLEDLPDNVKVHSIVWIKIDGRTLRGDQYGISDDGRELILSPAPGMTKRNAIEIRVVLVPTQNCTEVGVHLCDEWAEVVAAGTLARLRRIPNKAWTDINLSILNTQTYEAGIVRARNAADRGRKNEELNTQRRRFSV